MHEFGLESAEEALHRGVVQAVPLSAHRGGDAICLEQLAVVATGILNPAVGVVDQTPRRPPVADGHLQRIFAHGTLETVRHRPADDFHRGEVLHRSEVEPTLLGRNVADVSQPYRVRDGGREVTVEQVWRHSVRVPTVGGDGHAALPTGRPNAVLFHQLGDRPLGDPSSPGVKIGVNPGGTVPLPAGREALPNLNDKNLTLSGAFGSCGSRPLPGMKPAAGHAENPAHQTYGVLGQVGGDEGELRAHVFAAH